MRLDVFFGDSATIPICQVWVSGTEAEQWRDWRTADLQGAAGGILDDLSVTLPTWSCASDIILMDLMDILSFSVAKGLVLASWSFLKWGPPHDRPSYSHFWAYGKQPHCSSIFPLFGKWIHTLQKATQVGFQHSKRFEKARGFSPIFCGASDDVGFPNLQPQIVVILSLKPSKWARVLSSFFAFNPPN